MIARRYPAGQRRAINIIWTAAGRYDLAPPFLAIRNDGDPDFYMNMIVGFSLKWLDAGKMEAFFLSYQRSSRVDSFDTVIWLALENLLYHRENAKRPALSALREEHARQFMDEMQTLSRQQMMLKDMQVYLQEEYRWAGVLGIRKPSLSPWGKSLAEKLFYVDDEADTDSVIQYLKDILYTYFHFTDSGNSERRKAVSSESMRRLLRRIFRRERQASDSLLQRSRPSSSSSAARKGAQTTASGGSGKGEADLSYIRACFGPCIFTENEMQQLEADLCTGSHALCSLWIARPQEEAMAGAPEDAGRVLQQALAQEKKNQNYFQSYSLKMESSVRKLSSELGVIFRSFLRPLPVEARAGTLRAEKAWRLGVLHDPAVFFRPGDEVENNITVDILLDASASRMQHQEEIAAQACILSRSFAAAHIRHRIMDFRSLRGYTVLQILKDYSDRDASGVFRYFASGWNRDGLALLALERLTDRSSDSRIILIMTDANPEDSTKIAFDTGARSRAYSDAAAVQDTKSAVKQLKKAGAYVGAVYTGPSAYIGNVHEIYGSCYVRIERVEQLASGVSSLLQAMLRGMKE